MKGKLIIVCAFLLSILGLTRVAIADPVDYDELDAMALKMAGQTDQLQATDQFVRVYSQVLAFDESEYGTSFNQAALEASMIAGGIAWAYDDGLASTEETRAFIESLGFFALDLYGYGAGTPKYLDLGAIWKWLGKAWGCYWRCDVEYWGQVWKCISGTVGSIFNYVGFAISAIGSGLWVLGAVSIGKVMVVVGAIVIVGVLVVCILLEIVPFYKCLYHCLFP